MPLSDFIPEDGQRRIAQAITDAERKTSGEICVHVTPHIKESDVMASAEATFNRLKLYTTVRRNAVLIYVAYHDRQLAIMGDKGINDHVPEGFWDDVVATLLKRMRARRPVDGLCEAIATVGDRLSEFFPADRDDINELSNEVTFED
ncbi:MAG: TPM domain-containing protein [Muribaculaceae bacterium]|nr:TPM domain-containing protein [Muribaculaceae bacterium]